MQPLQLKLEILIFYSALFKSCKTILVTGHAALCLPQLKARVNANMRVVSDKEFRFSLVYHHLMQAYLQLHSGCPIHYLSFCSSNQDGFDLFDQKMNPYFSGESRDTLKSFSLFLFVKTMAPSAPRQRNSKAIFFVTNCWHTILYISTFPISIGVHSFYIS